MCRLIQKKSPETTLPATDESSEPFAPSSFPSLYDTPDGQSTRFENQPENQPGAMSIREQKFRERLAQAEADIAAGKPIKKRPDEGAFSSSMHHRMR